VARFAPQHRPQFRYGDYSLLRAPIGEHSILQVCGFNGTSFVEVADILLTLATMVGRTCSSFR